MSKTTNRFSPGVRARAVRMKLNHEADCPSRWSAVASVADKIGCAPQTLHEWTKKAEVESGRPAGFPTDTTDKAPVQAMIRFIDDNRGSRGFAYVPFVIDGYARSIVDWWMSRTARASFVLDAREQALHDRRPVHRGGLDHHSDRGSQHMSIKYTERLAEVGVEPSVGSVGESDDNASAETINGLYEAEVIHRRGPWRSLAAVEFATLERIDWFNHRRLLEPIGNIPLAEAEKQYCALPGDVPMAA